MTPSSPMPAAENHSGQAPPGEVMAPLRLWMRRAGSPERSLEGYRRLWVATLLVRQILADFTATADALAGPSETLKWRLADEARPGSSARYIAPAPAIVGSYVHDFLIQGHRWVAAAQAATRLPSRSHCGPQ